MTKPLTIRGVLDKYLSGYASEILDIDAKYGGKLGKITDESHKEELALLDLYIKTVSAQLKQIFLDVVGENEPTVNHPMALTRDDIPKEYRNELRAELRAKIKEIFNEE